MSNWKPITELGFLRVNSKVSFSDGNGFIYLDKMKFDAFRAYLAWEEKQDRWMK